MTTWNEASRSGRAAPALVGMLLVGGTLRIHAVRPVQEVASVPRVAFPEFGLVRACAFAPTFTADGRTMVLAISVPECGRFFTLVISHRTARGWSRPEVLPFSGRYSDGDPSFSPDGRVLFFISDRPRPGASGTTHRNDYDIWVVERRADGRWGVPRHLPAPINSDYAESSPTLTRDGVLYFASRRPVEAPAAPARGDSSRPRRPARFKLYRAALGGMTLGQVVDPRVELLPAPVNDTTADDVDPYVPPDAAYVVFSSTRRGGAGEGDLYVACRDPAGWRVPQRLVATASPAWEFDPRVSRDGRTLYFASERATQFPDPRPRRWTYADLLTMLRSYDNGIGHLYRVPFADPCVGPAPRP